jgi:hypothetical protein
MLYFNARVHHAVMRAFWTKVNVDQAKQMRANLLSA